MKVFATILLVVLLAVPVFGQYELKEEPKIAVDYPECVWLKPTAQYGPWEIWLGIESWVGPLPANPCYGTCVFENHEHARSLITIDEKGDFQCQKVLGVL